jgi:hypothetical protein
MELRECFTPQGKKAKSSLFSGDSAIVVSR